MGEVMTAISHVYTAPTTALLAELQAGAAPTPIDGRPGLVAVNHYRVIGLRGHLPVVYGRSAVVGRLHAVLAALGPGYSLLVYDCFRTRETQRHLFETIYAQLKAKDPHLTHEELWQRTKNFAAHPDHPSRYGVNPHNSGGAVDLSLAFQGTPLEMGTAFDEPVAHAGTDFFEQPPTPILGHSEAEWHAIRANRRLLFNAMKAVGFVNYAEEWWHYGLGDPLWAAAHGLDWCYDSLESAVTS